ncbi:cytochrome P450 monooxygenase-like protein [Westerdykella ornata]|uniref:Cytochrome P450 monooxygenase-like protein n=1 Tax=Westerdykella ornata TaxID=318751 RepID=A0A6A6JW21_WESOR|nr:cytochrome P450 monooxygenase-like protein [Westerdykella ornata]KAF2279249.1 cytochrome P450 monooxygenase-like protein [Westerdykella ornata]
MLMPVLGLSGNAVGDGQTAHPKRIARPWPLSWLPLPIIFTVDKFVKKGYEEVIKKRDEPFTMRWWGLDYIFMPPKYLHDLKKARFEDLSFFENISYAFSLHASAEDIYSSTIMIDVVKKKLNPKLPSLVPVLAEETDYAFEKVFENAGDWTEFNTAKMSAELMQRTTCAVLLSRELCRYDAFIKKSLAFGESLFGNAVLQTLVGGGPIRDRLVYVASYLHRRKLNRLLDMVAPVVQKRIEERRGAKPIVDVDAIDWNIELADGNPKEFNARRIANQLIHNLFAGTGAPASVVTQILFQLLMEPEYLEPLQQEVTSAFETYGKTEKALNNMPLMESFIMEILRLQPPGCVTAARTVMNKSFQFHDGLQLPAGTRIAFPILAIQTDPDNIEEAAKFDGKRLLKAKSADNASAATVSMTNLAFGYGKHACVGRYYTIRKIKLIVAKMITEYEFKWAKPIENRPANFPIMGQFAPNLETTVLVRRLTSGLA